MNDLELKALLLETCPVRPGQEECAWSALKDKIAPNASRLKWLFVPAWRSLAFAAVGIFMALAIFDLGLTMRPARHALILADSQSPGIYATSFYSNSAQAQVVWLNGMEPASDKPTYLDPTTVLSSKSKPAGVSRPSNSL
jgi:hypothetical protein